MHITIASMITEEQIERFFKKQCTAREARQVAEWLQAHPEAAASYLKESEWQAASADSSLSGQTYDEVWSVLNHRIRKKKRVLLLQRCAVAACISGCIASGFFYFNKQHPKALTATVYSTKPALVALADTEYNHTLKARRILLPDGSAISLQPQSVVWFDTPYAKKQRNIHLSGEARFEVAKNKQQPFTVYASAFATTALGTEFIVKEKENNITVQLLHGKVMIRATDTLIRNWKNVYLLPGQQMVYDEQDATTKVSFANEKNNTATASLRAQTAAHFENADSLLFNGSPVAAVFQKLSTYYKVNIQFTESELRGISFTGVVAKKDSVQNILKVITRMNDLTLEENDSGFIILKNQDPQ